MTVPEVCPDCGHAWPHHVDEWPCDAMVETWDDSVTCGCPTSPPPSNLPALVASHPGLRMVWGDEFAGVIALGEGTAGGYLHVVHAGRYFRVYRQRWDRVVEERSGLERDEVVQAMREIAGIE